MDIGIRYSQKMIYNPFIIFYPIYSNQNKTITKQLTDFNLRIATIKYFKLISCDFSLQNHKNKQTNVFINDQYTIIITNNSHHK